MADTSDIDAAVLGKLAGDPQLAALLPGGVGWYLSPTTGAVKYGIVSQVDHDDRYVMAPGIAGERIVYEVKAVTKSGSWLEVISAAKRMHVLLHEQSLTATGYYPILTVLRSGRFRFPQVDPVTSERWLHCGAQYEVFAYPVS